MSYAFVVSGNNVLLNNTANFLNDVNAKTNLTVSGTTTLNGDNILNGTTTLNGQLRTNGSININSGMNIFNTPLTSYAGITTIGLTNNGTLNNTGGIVETQYLNLSGGANLNMGSGTLTMNGGPLTMNGGSNFNMGTGRAYLNNASATSLAVNGHATIGNTLNVTGSSTFVGTSAFKNNMYIQNGAVLNVNNGGNVVLNNGGNVVLNDGGHVLNNLGNISGVRVLGNTASFTNLYVSTTTVLASHLTISGNATAKSISLVSNLIVNGNATVEGNITLPIGNITTNTLNVSNSINVDGSVGVVGTVYTDTIMPNTPNGQISIYGVNLVNLSRTVINTVVSTTDALYVNNAGTDGAVVISQESTGHPALDITISGTKRLVLQDKTLTVSGNVIVASNLTISGTTSIGTASIGNTLTITGKTTMNENLTVSGLSTFNQFNTVQLTPSTPVFKVNNSTASSTYFTISTHSNTETCLAQIGGELIVGDDITAFGTITQSSDERLKTNVKTLTNSLELVSKLRGVEYDLIRDNSHNVGLIAQEVEAVVPEVVKTDTSGMKSVAYANLVAHLIEAIKELKAKVELLENK